MIEWYIAWISIGTLLLPVISFLMFLNGWSIENETNSDHAIFIFLTLHLWPFVARILIYRIWSNLYSDFWKHDDTKCEGDAL